MKNGKVILWSILGVSILVVGILLGGMLFTTDWDKQEIKQGVEQQKEPNSVAEEVKVEPVEVVESAEVDTSTKENAYKSDYIEGCSPNGITNMEYCECTYDYLVKEFGGEKEFLLEAVKFVETGTAPDILTDATISCFYLYEE